VNQRVSRKNGTGFVFTIGVTGGWGC
jgi:hypothetical protein